MRRQREPRREIARLLNSLQEKLIALGFLHFQLANHVETNDHTERDLTVAMLVQEESEKIEQVGQLISEVMTILPTTRENPSKGSYIS